ncbi:MAG: T9SS type A sorting domain-containing protein [Saprospiraceae bacterium]
MKRQLSTLVIILMGMLVYAQNGPWLPTKGPYGGASTLTDGHNGKLYCQAHVNNKIVYRSTDEGLSWELTSGFGNTPSDKRFIGEAGNFYYKTGNSWYRSNDEGQTWNSMGSLANNITEIQETATGALIGWNPAQNKFYRSTNGGQTWVLIEQFGVSSSDGPVNSISIISGVIVAQNTGSDTKKAYISQDDGLNWVASSTSNEYSIEFVSPSGAIFYERNGTELYRRNFSLSQFNNVLVGGFYPNMTILPSGRLLIDILGEIKYSDNDGITWNNLTTNIRVGELCTTKYLPDSSIFCNVSGNIYKSSDGGATWEYSNYGLGKGRITNMKFVNDSLYFATTTIGLWKTTNAGNTWELLAEQHADELSESYFSSFAITASGGLLYVQKNTLQYSAAANDTFIDITPPQSQVTKYSKVFVNPNNNQIFLAHDKGLSRSNDLGQSWTTNTNYKNPDLIFHPSGRIVVSTGLSVLLSDNNGNSWVTVANPFPPSTVISSMVVSPNGTIFMYRAASTTNIMRSDDVGETWYLAGEWPFVPPSIISGLFFASNGHLYARGFSTFLSVNEGLSWQNIDCPGSSNCMSNYSTLTPSQKFFIQDGVNDCYISDSPVTEGSYIEGYVRIDADSDCSTDDAQEPIRVRNLEAIGNPVSFYTNTNAEGHYIFFVDTGHYEILIQHPNSIWWADCQDTVSVEISDFNSRDTVDFAATPLAFCPLMTVDLAIPQLRRCFNNQIYVSYCNQGTEPAYDAWVDIFLDPFLSLVSSGQPHENLGNNTYRFSLGDVQAEECAQFQLTVYVDCGSTVLSQTHCISAHAFPDTLCSIVPDWSGANITATATCQDSIIQLRLLNDGVAASQTLDYIIIEDDVMLLSGQQSYDIGQAYTLNFPTNGSTWRIESQQEPGHPFSTLALAFAEGCGGFGSTGYINQFSVNGIEPSWHRSCLENTGSYDPNDKQGFPFGSGTDHDIRPGQDIDYLIRFQNTGTDTAFTVRIRDTLSALLDPASIRPGASSHPYTWELTGEGIISFTFPNILLPDSNINVAASQGFVQFNIKQRPNIPLGSVIENQAAIYFDFNAPVLTNTTWHTVRGMAGIISSVQNPSSKATQRLDIWPNPCHESTNIRYNPTSGSPQHHLKIYDMLGNLVLQKRINKPDIELQTNMLSPGLYMAELRDARGVLVGIGRLLKQ